MEPQDEFYDSHNGHHADFIRIAFQAPMINYGFTSNRFLSPTFLWWFVPELGSRYFQVYEEMRL